MNEIFMFYNLLVNIFAHLLKFDKTLYFCNPYFLLGFFHLHLVDKFLWKIEEFSQNENISFQNETFEVFMNGT